VVTPTPEDDAVWLAQLERALANGVRRVHLRAPGLDAARWHALLVRAAHLCRQAGAEALVNGDAALAIEFGLGLHLPARLLHALSERPIPVEQPLAASCHDVEDLLAAEAMGCDFAVLGTLKPTPSHPGVEGIGWDGFAAMRERVSLPMYAIGGLGLQDLDQARSHGAQGIAAIRGLWPAP
jgi:8-oxo-dGTP diphosphatase